MLKRGISLFLALAMVFCIMPVETMAAEILTVNEFSGMEETTELPITEETTVTEETAVTKGLVGAEEASEINQTCDEEDTTSTSEAIIITTAEELALIESGKNYLLGNDIDLSTYNNGVWLPLSCSDVYLDGQGFQITNLAIPAELNMDYAGLFGNIKGTCTIQNLNVVLSDKGISGRYKVGGIAASFSGEWCQFINCSVVGAINAQRSSVGDCEAGGIIGDIFADNYTTITNCQSNVNLNAQNNASVSYGQTSSSIAAGLCAAIGGNNSNVIISNNRSYGHISAKGVDHTRIGGLVGTISCQYVNVDNNFTENDIVVGQCISESSNYSSGLCGNIAAVNVDFNNNNSSSNISLEYNLDMSCGGLIGTLSLKNDPDINIEECSFDGKISVQYLDTDITNCGGIIGSVDKSFSSDTESAVVIHMIGCEMNGSINTIDGAVGGLIAAINRENVDVNVENCSFAGQLSLTSYYGGSAGGFIGEAWRGNCNLHFTNVVAEGIIEKTVQWDNTPIVGGFAGYVYGNIYLKGENIYKMDFPLYGKLVGTEIKPAPEYRISLACITGWDAENQIAYFEDDLLHLGAEVTDETDTSFLDSVQEMLNQYVLVETRPRDDGMVGPDILISMEPVEAGTGTVQERTKDSLTVDDIVYPLALKEKDPVVGADKGDEVLYGVQDGKIVILVPLTTTTMRLEDWDPDSRVLAVSSDLTTYTYKVSTLASEESLAFLNADRESDKSYNIEFSYDLSGKIAYRIYRVYETAEGSETPENDESSQYIIDRVKEYTTEEFYAQYDEILNSNASNEVILQRLTELFDTYGFLDVMEGVHYLSNTQGNRYAYRTLLSDQMYCAWNYYDWLHNTAKGTAARAVMVVDGLIFNNEFSDWTDITNYVDDDYPAAKKYKDMLYDFMDAEALEIEVMSYISSINQLSQKCTEAGKIYADSLIEKINACTSRDDLHRLMGSAEAQGLFLDVKTEGTNLSDVKITYTLDKSSGFGKFAKAMGYAGDVISLVDMTVDNVTAFIELDSKLEVYSQYRSFLSEIQSATELPLEMRLAARSILREMEEGEWHQINALASDIFGELLKVVGSETGFKITDEILKKVIGETGASSLSSYLAVINVSAFCINKIVDVGELIRGVQFVEGYVLLQNYYKEQLLASRDAFVDNPTAENAWAFFEDYNILYRLRYRGEKAYLAMSDIKGAIRIFTDFGYPVKAEVAETTMNLLEERCQFTIDEGVEVPESVSYFTKTVIDCPVNVEVYSPEGELIATLMDGVESDISNEHGRFAVVYRPYTGEYAKVICLKENGNYRFRLVASGDGLVSFKMASKSDQNPVLYSFDHVAVSTDEVIETSVEQVLKENAYSIDTDGNGNFEGTGEILTSVSSDNIPVQSISLDETDLNLAVGESVVLNYSILPTEATCQNVLWISSDPETVEIANGMATALKEGTAVIYCSSQDNLSLSSKCEIDVAAAHQHTITLVPSSAATCCSTGIKEHWHCTTCGKDFTDSAGTVEMSDVTIPVNAQNHTGGTEIRNAVKATSEAEGYTGDAYCLGCGAKIASGTVIPKLTTNNPDAPAASEPTTKPSITFPSQPSATTVPEKESASSTAKADDEEKTQAQETDLPNEDSPKPSQTPQANEDESTIQKSDSTVQETEEQDQESGSSILVYVVLVLAAGCVIFGAVWYLWRRKKQRG